MDEPGLYTKLPIQVRALQWSGRNWPAMVAFTESQDGGHVPVVRRLNDGRMALWIAKSNTWRQEIPAGDWVIAEADGIGFYPCTADEFARIYKPAEQD